MPLHFSAASLAPEVRQVLRRMVPGILGAGVTQLNLAVDVIIASFLPAGAVSYLYYADRVGQFPLGVIGAAVGTAMLPLLSRQVRSGESLSAHRTMNRAMELPAPACQLRRRRRRRPGRSSPCCSSAAPSGRRGGEDRRGARRLCAGPAGLSCW